MSDAFSSPLSSPALEQIRHYATLIVEQCAKDPAEENMESTLRTIEIAADKILDTLPEKNR